MTSDGAMDDPTALLDLLAIVPTIFDARSSSSSSSDRRLQVRELAKHVDVTGLLAVPTRGSGEDASMSLVRAAGQCLLRDCGDFAVEPQRYETHGIAMSHYEGCQRGRSASTADPGTRSRCVRSCFEAFRDKHWEEMKGSRSHVSSEPTSLVMA